LFFGICVQDAGAVIDLAEASRRPTEWRRDSTRLVLPDPPWPTTATFLMFVGSGDAIKTLPST
jgi:hypothetical protein